MMRKPLRRTRNRSSELGRMTFRCVLNEHEITRAIRHLVLSDATSDYMSVRGQDPAYWDDSSGASWVTGHRKGEQS